MSLFGAQQLANTFLQGRSEQPAGKTTAAFERITRATEGQFDDATKVAFRTGDQLQRVIVDFMYSLLTLEAVTPRGMMKTAFDMMQQSAEAVSRFAPGRENRLVWQEFKNKLQAFELFEHVDSVLQLPRQAEVRLPELVRMTEALGSYSSVWATEGLGHYFAETFLEQGASGRNPLKSERADERPARGLAALHAGMGLAIAERLMKSIEPRSSASEIRRVLKQFVALCQDNSREGYAGATCEALGLITRNLHPQMVPILDRQLPDVDEDLPGYFWHGVGRAIYFAPTNFLPDGHSLRRCLQAAQQEPPHELGRRNALAGLVWALTLVNIRQPEILELFLKQHGEQLSEPEAFVNGVSSAVMIWRDSVRVDPYLDALCRHRPDPSDAILAESWEQSVRRPAIEALQDIYPVVTAGRHLGEVFRYLDLHELARQADREAQAGESSYT